MSFILNQFSLCYIRSYFLLIPFLISLCLSDDVRSENLIENSSFELGLSQITSGGELHFMRGNSYHGKRYAKWNAGSGWLYLSSLKLPSLPGVYTLSAYLRTNVRETKVKLGFLDNKWKTICTNPVKVGSKWDRYNCTVSIMPFDAEPYTGKENIFTPFIFSYSPKAELYIDAIQIERGMLTDYSPRRKIKIGGWTEKYSNVFKEHEDLQFIISISNNTETAQKLNLIISVRNVYDREVFGKKICVDLMTAQTLQIPIKVPSTEKGHFRAYLKAFKNDTLVDQHVMNMARIWSIKDITSYHSRSSLGIHATFAAFKDSEIENKRWNLVVQSGVRWIRIFFNWKKVESKPGKYDWSYYDGIISIAKRNKLKILGVFSRKTPKWRVNGANKLYGPAYLDFCLNAIERYPNIDIWEMNNEPYGKYPASDSKLKEKHKEFFKGYVTFHQDAYRKIKAYSSNKMVLINGFGLYQKEANFRFLKDCATEPIGLLNFCDGLSYHLYPGYRPGEEVKRCTTSIKLIKSLLKRYNKENLSLWQTEMGVSSDDFFDDENNLYGEYNMHMKKDVFGYGPELDGAKSCVKYHVVQMANGVKVSFYFEIGNNYPYQNLFNMFKDRWLSPKVIYPAYNTLATLLDESAFIKEIRFHNEIHMYVFRRRDRGNNCVIPYWSMKDEPGFLKINTSCKIRVLDFMGNQIQAIKNKSGVRIPLSTIPYYLIIEGEEAGNITFSPP